MTSHAGHSPKIIILMGVSGTGKSTLGAALARATHLPFIDGDDLHPQANVEKMARGEALGDADRLPWLERIRDTAVACVRERAGVIVACSALKKTYRALLRGTPYPTYFVYLTGERDLLAARLEERRGHFMGAGMLQSQLDALESPEGEAGVVCVSVAQSTEEQVERVLDACIAT